MGQTVIDIARRAPLFREENGRSASALRPFLFCNRPD
jgi:hypothetical protein